MRELRMCVYAHDIFILNADKSIGSQWTDEVGDGHNSFRHHTTVVTYSSSSRTGMYRDEPTVDVVLAIPCISINRPFGSTHNYGFKTSKEQSSA